MKILVLLFLSFSALGQDLAARQYIERLLSPKVFEELAMTSQLLLDACSPPDCLIVGVGRSPTAIVDLLDIAMPGSVQRLPLSRFRYGGLKDTGYPDLAPLRPEQERILFGYFDDFLKIKKGVKRIMLVDYTISGASLFATETYLSKYFQKQNSKIAIESAALALDENVERVFSNPFKHPVKEPRVFRFPHGSRLGGMMEAQSFDAVSRYGFFNPLDEAYGTLPKSKTTSARAEFVKRLKEMVAHWEANSLGECSEVFKGPAAGLAKPK